MRFEENSGDFLIPRNEPHRYCTRRFPMNIPEPEILPDDLLFQIQRRIAQRADQLARSSNPFSPPSDYWCLAEREVWESHDDFVGAADVDGVGTPSGYNG